MEAVWEWGGEKGLHGPSLRSWEQVQACEQQGKAGDISRDHLTLSWAATLVLKERGYFKLSCNIIS